MKSLKLKIDDLHVESFDTRASDLHAGTVHGHEASMYPCVSVDSGCATCRDATCDTDITNCECWPSDDDHSCAGASCVSPETCVSPCYFSQMTNCHRCV